MLVSNEYFMVENFAASSLAEETGTTFIGKALRVVIMSLQTLLFIPRTVLQCLYGDNFIIMEK